MGRDRVEADDDRRRLPLDVHIRDEVDRAGGDDEKGQEKVGPEAATKWRPISVRQCGASKCSSGHQTFVVRLRF